MVGRFSGENDDLLEKVIDGYASDDERRRLADGLLEDEGLRVRYAELMRVHALLRCRCGLAGRTGQDPFQRFSSRTKRVVAGRWIVAAGFAAAGLVIGGLVGYRVVSGAQGREDGRMAQTERTVGQSAGLTAPVAESAGDASQAGTTPGAVREVTRGPEGSLVFIETRKKTVRLEVKPDVVVAQSGKQSDRRVAAEEKRSETMTEKEKKVWVTDARKSRYRASSLRGAVAGVALAALGTASADTATWMNTENGSVGYWTNAANWGAAAYPGYGPNESANFTASTASVYTARLDSPLPNGLTTLTLQNTAAGGAVWLVVSHAALSCAALSVKTGGRLQIDEGGVVSNGASLSLANQGGRIIVNAGGLMDNGGTGLTIGSNVKDNQVNVSGGCVTNVGTINVGNGSGSAENTLAITDGGRVNIQTNGLLTVGNGSGPSNTLVVSGGLLTCSTLELARFGGTGNFLYITNGATVLCGPAFGNGVSGTVGGNCQSSGSGGGNNGFALVSDGGTWDLGGQSLVVGRHASRSNLLWVGRGGVITNATVSISSGTTVNSLPWGNSLVVTNGGSIYGKGTLSVGSYSVTSNNAFYVVGGEVVSMVTNAGAIEVANTGGANRMWARKAVIWSAGLTVNGGSNNLVTVGDDVQWSLMGQPVTVGKGTSSVSNRLVLTGGVLTNAALLTVGSGTGASGNALVLSGGHLYGSSFSLSADNVLAPVIAAAGAVPLMVSGTATLANGSYLMPSNTMKAAAGTYTVLTAANVVNNGLQLAPGTDSQQWAFTVTPTAVTVTYRPRSGTVVLLF